MTDKITGSSSRKNVDLLLQLHLFKLKIYFMFPSIILIRILFATAMVFVIGYVFGNFSRSKALASISRVAAILAIVLFIAANAVLMRFGSGHRGAWHGYNSCYEQGANSSTVR